MLLPAVRAHHTSPQWRWWWRLRCRLWEVQSSKVHPGWIINSLFPPIVYFYQRGVRGAASVSTFTKEQMQQLVKQKVRPGFFGTNYRGCLWVRGSCRDCKRRWRGGEAQFMDNQGGEKLSELWCSRRRKVRADKRAEGGKQRWEISPVLERQKKERKRERESSWRRGGDRGKWGWK